MPNLITFCDQSFIPISVETGLTVPGDDQAIRVIKPEDNMEPDMETPALVVPQMFHGADARGGVGLYVDNGTDGLFRNLRVTCID